MDKILTLCSDCANLFSSGYKLKSLTASTTKLQKNCENCGRKYGELKLYLVKSKK